MAQAESTDVAEVRVFRDFGDVPLVGAIELVSPANKDRPEKREAFISPCDYYVREGVGLIIVDIVTESSVNLHSLLVERFKERELPNEEISAAAYRPVIREDSQESDVWYPPLQLGQPLTDMPLYLHNGPCARANLDATDIQVCEQLKLTTDN
ncbi:MAG: hypothetical protein R3B90_07420 [Planctomycetaceae bacterium]